MYSVDKTQEWTPSEGQDRKRQKTFKGGRKDVYSEGAAPWYVRHEREQRQEYRKSTILNENEECCAWREDLEEEIEKKRQED